MSIFGLFTAPLGIARNGLHEVIDQFGRYPIDNAYRNLGISEGWLIRTGYYRDEHNRLVWTYVHLDI